MEFFLSHFGSCPISFFLFLSVFKRMKKNRYIFFFSAVWTMTIRRRPSASWSQRYGLFSFSAVSLRPSFAFPKNNIVAKFGMTFNTPSCQAAGGWFVMDLLLCKSSAKRYTHSCNVFQPNVNYFGLMEYRLSRTRTYNITVMSGAFEPIKL